MDNLVLCYVWFIPIVILLSSLFLEWHARGVFVAIGYPRKYGHGKSWKRAHRHYKQNWTFIQRMLWIPVFKEEYDSKFRMLAYISYANWIIAPALVALTIVGYFNSADRWFFVWILIGFLIFLLIRFIYSNDLGRGKF